MLFHELTGRETLMLVGAIKGVRPNRLREVILSLSLRLNLDPVLLDTRVADYDLGPRRKLAFALSLLGSPRVLVLEEPFHEIDPESQSQMTKIIAEKQNYTTVIISTSK